MQTQLSPFVVRDIVRVVETDAHEGPVYRRGEDALYFTTIRRPEGVAIKRLALDGLRFPLGPERVSVVRRDANNANGMALDADGLLLVCEQGSLERAARISRLDPVTGATETVVDAWHSRRLNSPNDVVVAGDGTIWFTDPSYGHLQGFRPEPEVGDRVYRYDPASGRTTVAADGFDKPNGLAFSPDERILYVGDNGAPHHLLAFDVLDDGRLGEARRVAAGTPGHPDGVKVDADGRIYASASFGIQIHDPLGGPAGAIELPGAVNFAFGGPDRSVLFITTDTAVWAAQLKTKGA